MSRSTAGERRGSEHDSQQGGHHHSEVESFSYRGPHPIDIQQFRAFMDTLPRRVYRSKGFLNVVGGDIPQLFNYVCGRLVIEPMPALAGRNLDTQAVFIGTGVSDLEEILIRAFVDCCPDLAKKAGPGGSSPA